MAIRGFSAPARYVSSYRPSSYRSAPRVQASAPRFGFAPLRQVLGLRGAMGLNRTNMSGPGYYGPRVSQGNPIARNFYNVVNSQANLRTITKGPWVPSFGGLGISAGRTAQARGEAMSVRAFQRAVMENARQNRQTIVKYRDPRTGAVSDTPFSNMGLNRFGSNQGWRYQQNSARQTGNRRYSGGMSQFGINSPSGMGVNQMR